MDGTQDGATFLLGVVLTVGGVAGYGAGILAPYPGRAFTVTGVMVGITLAAIGSAARPGGEDP